MSDPMTPEVKDWMRRSDIEPPEAQKSARHVMARLPGVPQRRRWWPFPVFYKKPEMSTTGDQTSPIPATNGHSPTVIGRTGSMLSPVKAITAGAIVFVISGAFLIAQPFDRQGSVPGADAPSDPPTEFTGRLMFGPQVVVGTEEQGDGKLEIRGHVFSTPVSLMSDERLDGEWTRTNNVDQYDEPSVWAWQALWRVENDDGAWQGLETPIVFSDGSRSTTTSILVGEGEYEGLVAMTEFALDGQAWDLRGIIIDGEMPPAPEPVVSE